LIEHGDEIGGLLDGAVAFPVSANEEFAGFEFGRRVEGT
jgi:hypothetical protein